MNSLANRIASPRDQAATALPSTAYFVTLRAIREPETKPDMSIPDDQFISTIKVDGVTKEDACSHALSMFFGSRPWEGSVIATALPVSL